MRQHHIAIEVADRQDLPSQVIEKVRIEVSILNGLMHSGDITLKDIRSRIIRVHNLLRRHQ